MPDFNQYENDFLNRLTRVVEEHLSDENFGVSELAEAINMSRSNLLRRLKKSTGLSVSLFIRKVRLKHAMELLIDSSQNVTEVSYAVGFSSTSYFIKCFREEYGFPPGEASKRWQPVQPISQVEDKPADGKSKLAWGLAVVTALIFMIAYFAFKTSSQSAPTQLEKSIAVLPFKNDSGDSTNVYLINGLLESTLNNLQKIKDLRVVSRTSSEKYRNTFKSIPEIAKELNVSYFVEGSGQKIGNEILLNIQLIEAGTDRHLWAKQYSRQVTSIFELQEEIAISIAAEIQAIITPQEQNLIEKKPTNNLEAYDYFLKGQNEFSKTTNEGFREAIRFFNEALELDPEFARAHAGIAICYYYLDMFKQEKEYLTEINNHSDKALLYDPKLDEALMSKALYYMHNGEYMQAVPYLEKALEYNPNSAPVINMLSDFYANISPNTGKYLEYALKGVQLNVAAYDSVTTSFFYLNLSNALIQTGFVDEALKYVDVSLGFNPENPFSKYVKAYMLYAQNHDWDETRRLIIKEWEKDTTRLDILQDVAKAYYYKRDYDSAYYYFKKFIAQRDAAQLDIYRHQHGTIALVFEKMGFKKEAEAYFADYKDFAEHDQSIYKGLNLSVYYAHFGDLEKSLAYMDSFSEEDNYMYWVVLFPDDPLTDKIKDLPEYKRLTKKIETKFWKNHDRIRASLENKGLLKPLIEFK
ncbi:helix-turn-helix domain-containing protein [Roseivirga echinicomitans]|uniref:AraC family transcriptional regulator n=1 Tax=Roseivirga echinicomitans TaxID=296218 RepID=A0A150XD65_9BACT|nr:helix-turn-helix domain-containing protein [Roseivirga echinicomitans]KYG76630.1 AraC family transcriptional regulator [Roseivirga echinicomitans]